MSVQEDYRRADAAVAHMDRTLSDADLLGREVVEHVLRFDSDRDAV
jgi:hypothetical protein